MINIPSNPRSNPNIHALLIGFNEYKDNETFHRLKFAQKDAEDFYETLTDKNYGCCNENNITLISNGIKTEKIESKINDIFFKNSGEKDTVIFFYSGHGFVNAENGKTYLATPDVTVNDILDNPRKGIDLEYLHDDVFIKSSVRNIIFILDCCFSGGFVPPEYKGNLALTKLIPETMFRSTGKVAFVSCTRDNVSRESDQFRNGVFTHFLIKGLKGEALNYHSGSNEVTLDSLVSYVSAKTPTNQKPVRYGQETGPIILTRPVLTIPTYYKDEISAEFPKRYYSENEPPSISALKNPLDDCLSIVDKLLLNLDNSISKEETQLGSSILTAIQFTLNGDFAGLINISEDPLHKAEFTYFSNNDQLNFGHKIYVENLSKEIGPFLYLDKNELQKSKYGFLTNFSLSNQSKNNKLLIIPLNIDFPRIFLVISGLNNESLSEGEAIGSTVQSIYRSTKEFTTYNRINIEAALIDDLKRHFGYLPKSFLDRRYRLFAKQVDEVVFYFEPVLFIGHNSPEIDSWEALARDPETEKCPETLFSSAELWGSEFINYLDNQFFQKTIDTYIKQWEIDNSRSKIDPLSVNIYPETFFFDDFYHTLEATSKKYNLINNGKLTIELSEKRSLSNSKSVSILNDDHKTIQQFRDRINMFTSKFCINFAIDDFGSGYSNISRLSYLKADYVKIDKSILSLDNPGIVFNLVNDLIKSFKNLSSKKIIAEGIDLNKKQILKDIIKSGIYHIQGYIVRKASPSLENLSRSKMNLIKKIISGYLD